jgi:hypothetical protein
MISGIIDYSLLGGAIHDQGPLRTQRHQRAVPGELKLSQDIGDQIRMRNRQQAVESEPARIGDSRLKQRVSGKASGT